MTPKEERALRTRQEQAYGRMKALENMTEGLLEFLMAEIDPLDKFSYVIVKEGDDFRTWEISVSKDGIEFHKEPFAVFPSEELKAKIMLLGGN